MPPASVAKNAWANAPVNVPRSTTSYATLFTLARICGEVVWSTSLQAAIHNTQTVASLMGRVFMPCNRRASENVTSGGDQHEGSPVKRTGESPFEGGQLRLP